MKLQYFYIICFLVSIDWSFCYECTNKGDVMRQKVIKRNAKSKHGRQKHHQRRIRRQELEEDKDPVASIDIANFIQQPDPDYESIEDPRQYKNRRRASKYYDDFESLNEMEMSLKNTANENLKNDLEALEGSNGVYDKMRKSSFSEDALNEDSVAHPKDNVKLSKRHQAIPFFSRDDKEKKQKKRKFFNFGKKTTGMTTLLPKFEGHKPDLKNRFNRVVKRSNYFSFCPLCKRKIIPKEKKEKHKKSRKNIHNSRQYYQTLGDVAQKKRKKAISNNEFHNFNNNKVGKREKRGFNDADEYDLKESQPFKRGDATNLSRERQLKELEAIQKKVDAIEIKFPGSHFNQKQQKNSNDS